MRALVVVVVMGCVGPRPDPTPAFGPTEWLVRVGSAGDAAWDVVADHFGDVIVYGTRAGQPWLGKRWGDDGSEQWTLAADVMTVSAPAAIDSANNVIVAGTSPSTKRAAIAELDREGNVRWRSDLPAESALWTAVGADDRVFVSGRVDDAHVYVAAFEPDGTPRWLRTIAWRGCTPRIAATDDGHVLAVETTQPSQRDTFGPLTLGTTGGIATLVARFDPDGNLERAIPFGDPTMSLDVSRVARASADSVAILTALSAQLVVVDAGGTPRWWASGADVPSAKSVASLGDGRIVLAGPSFVAAFDDTGAEIDRRPFLGVAMHVVAGTPDAGVVVAGDELALARLAPAAR